MPVLKFYFSDFFNDSRASSPLRGFGNWSVKIAYDVGLQKNAVEDYTQIDVEHGGISVTREVEVVASRKREEVWYASQPRNDDTFGPCMASFSSNRRFDSRRGNVQEQDSPSWLDDDSVASARRHSSG
jgi:hypothetical protein